MRIVQAIESSGPGGAEQIVLALCRMLAERGHQVSAMLLRDGWLREQLESQGTPVECLSIGAALDPRFALHLRRRLREQRVELLHSHEITFALYGRMIRMPSLSQVATAHGSNFVRNARRQAAGRLLFRGDRFRLVAVSDQLAGGLAASLRWPRERIEVVANAIDVPLRDRPLSRRPGEPLRLIAVGNLYAVKNHELAIHAVARLRGAGRPISLDILGRGAMEPALRDLIDELDVSESVRLLGFRSDVVDRLDAAHVFLSTSHFEAMPLSFLEAMARGVPIAASRVGGVPELVEHDESGLLFEPGDLEGLVAALGALEADETRRFAFAGAGLRLARASHRPELMVERYEAMYRSVLGRQAVAR